MMKARDQQADPMKSPRLVTMLALACSGPSKKPLEKKSNAYIARIFSDCSMSRERFFHRSRASSLERNKTVYKKLYRRGAVTHREENPYEI